VAADTGQHFPTTSGPTNWSNPDNVFVDDGNDAIGSGNATQQYLDFNFGIPAGANIKGVVVTVQAKAAAIIVGTADIDFRLSWDGGTSWSNTKTAGWVCILICFYDTKNLGGSTDTWGHAWSESELSNTNFRLRGTSGGIGFGTRVDYIQVQVYYAAISGANTSISSSPTTVTADGISISTITVQARDDTNTVYTTGGNSVVLSENGSAIIGPVTDVGDGTYSATMTNTTAESITISGSISSIGITDTAAVNFTPGDATAAQTTISTSQSILTADGSSTTVITVQTIDAQGNNLSSGGNTIVLAENGSAIISGVTDLGDGTYTATISNTVAEEIIVSGSLNGTSITDTASVTFIPGTVSVTQSTIEVSSSPITADGTTSATITVQAKDSQGNDLNSGGLAVTLSENGNALISGVTDNGNGTYTASITNTTAESITISALIAATPLTDTADIGFIAGPAASSQTTISTAPTTVTADGSSISTITVQTRDIQGNALSLGGSTIVLSENGDATIGLITDNGNGTYTASLTNTSAELITINGTLNGFSITDTATTNFIPGAASTAQSMVTVSPSSVLADGISSSIITVQTRDAQGNNLAGGGLLIALVENGNATISPVTDVGDGTYTATITDALAESIIVSATLGGLAIVDTASLTFTPGVASPSQTTLSVSTASVTADGVSTSIITVQTNDALGNNLSIGGDAIVLSENGSGIISPLTDNNNGTYTATITNTVAEAVTISGTLNTSAITNTADVTFIAGVADAAQSIITASPASVLADGAAASTITIQTKDAQGNNLTTGGETIVLAQNGSSTLSGVTDVGDGTYTATATNFSAETVTISGTLNGTSITDVGSITFTPGTATTAQTTITVSPSTVTADGTSTSTITVQSKDSNNNNLVTGGNTITLIEDGSATISAVTDNGNGSYTATITNTVAENINITGTLNSFGIVDNASVNFVAGSSASASQTLISVSPVSLTADGLSSAAITVQAKDTFGNDITSGGLSIFLTENGSAVISSIIDNGNGTYSATITNTVAEAIIISGTMNASALTDTASLTFTVGIASTTTTTITATPTTLTADGVSTSTITIQTQDSQGNRLEIGGDTLSLSENGNAIISGITDVGNGTYTATVTNSVAEVIIISGQLNTFAVIDSASITFTPGTAVTGQTTIVASPVSITADGTTTSTITVQTKDAQGNNLTTGGSLITLSENGNAIIGFVTDHNNGSYSATITNTTAESVIISGLLGAGSISDTASVTFIAGAASLANTIISAAPTSVTANGITTSTITVQAIDAQGNNLSASAATVVLSTSGSANLSGVTNVGNGTYTATVTNLSAESIIISGTLGGGVLTDTATITFTPGTADTTTSTISVSPASVVADGSSTSIITVQLKDAQGNNQTSGGQTIAISSTGSGSIGSVSDNGNGTYSASITNTIAEPVTITATLNSNPITDSASISFTSGTISTLLTLITASPLSAVANGVDSIEITLQAIDNLGNNLTSGGADIGLAQDGNASLQPVLDNGDGTYTANLTSTIAETLTVSGTIAGIAITDSETITFTAGPPTTSQTTISAAPSAVTANGTTEATITVQAVDSQGNNLSIGGANILVSTSGSGVLSDITDNSNGTYQATITNTVAEIVTVSATLEGVTIEDTSDVTFNPGAVSATETIITVIPVALIADGISTAPVTVQTRDSFGNNLVNGGLTILLMQDGSAIFTPIIDKGDGSYTANITNTVAELITIGGTITDAGDGIVIGNTDELLFIAGNASSLTSTITASPTTVAADGISSSIITVQARDSENNNLSNGGDSIILTENGSAIISMVSDNGDGTYSATVTDNVAETITIAVTINGTPIIDSEDIVFTPGASSAANSTLFASKSLVTAGGVDTSLLTIQVYDALSNLLSAGGDTIELSNSGDAAITPVIDQLNGTYTATISNTTIQSTLITATLNGIPMTDTETIDFIPGGPAQINATDGRFINGLGPLGSAITIQDAFGTTLCTSNTDILTGKYHCLITAPVSNGQQLTVIATDLANNSESSAILIDSTDNDDDGISNTIETLVANNGGAANTEPNTDSDGDKLPDYAEVILDSNFLSIDSPSIAGDFDIDLDGVTDAVEFYFNAAGGSIDSQLSTDSDGDGIPDVTELITRKSDFIHVNLPVENGAFDTDADSVTDAVEFYLSIFSILNVDDRSDYDRDGYSDALEVRLASDPLHANQPDIDNDGVNDAIEAYLTNTINDNSDTVLMDRDNDDLPDIFELSAATDLTDPTDNINDGNNGDTDGDGISDAIETYLTGNTFDALITDDVDTDGITDIDEISLGSNPSAHSKPVVWINTTDLGNGSVEMYANLGGFQAPYPSVNWDTSEIQIASPTAIIGATNERSLTVSGLDEGKYTISLTLEQTFGILALSSSTSQPFSVTNTGFQDADFDGVSDGFDVFNGALGLEETLQTTIEFNETYLTQTQYSTSVRAGLIARLGDNEISTISYNQLNDFIYQDFPITPGDKAQNENIETTPNLFDINIINIPTTGSTVSVVIPLNHPLSADAAVLVFNHSTFLWSFFETSTTDNVMSFIGSPGLCPAAEDASYSTGLIEGSYCLQLQITDGGINDQDNSLNGVIPLLTGIGSNNLFPDISIPDLGIDDETDSGLDNSEDDTPPEIPDAQQNKSSGGGGSLHPISLLIFGLLCISCSFRSSAAPENGLITFGEGSIINTPSLTTITQNTDRLSIEWDSFNIANGETVNFIQPDSSSIAINQDFSGNASEIFGSINANGQIILLNGAGILIGETGSINVGGFLASDLTPNSTNFSDNSLSLSETNTQVGGIVNLGSIQTFTEGGVYIAGQFISNSGDILSSNGDIHLAIADDVIVTTSPDGILGIEITSPLTSNISNSGGLVTNDGNVVAFNGNIYLDVFYSDTIKADAVNNTGIINAVEITQGTGIINLSANTILIAPTDTTDINSIISDSFAENDSSSSTSIVIEISPQPKTSLNTIMPECDNNDGLIKDCSKYKAIKRYLGQLLLGGRLPESTQ